MRLLTARMLADCGIGADSVVLVGLSGGADSVFLLLSLCMAREAGEISGVAAAHLNHGIRGADADGDEAFCRALCQRCAIPFLVEHADVPAFAKEHGMTLEAAARAVRYDFLHRAKQTAGAHCIAVAHHRDDQAETVLLHLLRGSALRGLCGMKARTGDIVRPMLKLSRSQIEAALAEWNEPYCIDATNCQMDAERNKIRWTLLPELAKFNPAISQTLCRMGDLLSQDEAYLEKLSIEALDKAARNGGYDRKQLAKLPLPLKTRAVRRILEADDPNLSAADIRRVSDLLEAQTGKRIELGGARSAWVDAETVRTGIWRENEFCLPFSPGETVTLPGGTLKSEIVTTWQRPKDPFELFLDLDQLPQALEIRTRRAGDRFFPLGAPGTRKLSDYLVDRKVPLQARDMPLLCSGNEVFAVMGHTICEKGRITANTSRILHMYYTEEKLHGER